MSNKNIVLMLHEGLDKSTGQKVYPTDIAHLLGYGPTQIKQYFKWAKEGEIKKPNDRLERAAWFAHRLGELEGFETLFPLIPKLSGELDDAECIRRAICRANKVMRGDKSIEGQMDLVEETERPETDDQNKPLLVSLECPEMVEEVSQPEPQEDFAKGYKENVEVCACLIEQHFSDKIPEPHIRQSMAGTILQACDQLKMKGIAGQYIRRSLDGFIVDMAMNYPRPYKLSSMRVMRGALADSSFMQEWLPDDLKTETDDQISNIMWPKFVKKETREALKNFDVKKINWALAQQGERVINRVLAGYVKEVKNG